MSDSKRVESKQKDRSYEQLLEQVNLDVESLNRSVSSRCDQPIIFIVGIPRSGSTLLYQALAATGVFGYCTNLIARFYRNPTFGLRVQRLLEPVLPERDMNWESEFGRTRDWYGPHEFGYFWEHHLPLEQQGHEPEVQQEESVDWATLRGEINALLSGFDKPLVFKNLTINFWMSALAEHLDDVRFVHIRRDPVAVGASLYRVRESFFGSPDEWFSIRPAGIEEVQDASPVEQIVWQMRRVDSAVDALRDEVDGSAWAEVTYEEFCESPSETIDSIVSALRLDVTPGTEGIPTRFEPSGVRGPDDVVDELQSRLGGRA